jgi:hypothetical protein
MDLKYEDESEDGSLPSVDGGYKGTHISFPLTRSDLDALIDTFRKKKVRKSDKCYYFHLKIHVSIYTGVPKTSDLIIIIVTFSQPRTAYIALKHNILSLITCNWHYR